MRADKEVSTNTFGIQRPLQRLEILQQKSLGNDSIAGETSEGLLMLVFLF